jgi:hypothetical protein
MGFFRLEETMTNTYPTSDLPLGTDDPRALYNNLSNADEAINAVSFVWTDRFGRTRKSWAGFENDNLQWLIQSGFESAHLTYVVGKALAVARPTQLIDYNKSVYRVKMPASFPVMLTGDWATDSPNLVDVGDATLRAALAQNNGAKQLVGGSLFKGEVSDPGNAAAGTSVTRSFVHAYYPERAGAIRIGGSDMVPLDDERGYWSGLPSQNAWGDPNNVGLFSQAFGRNGASYAPYSTTFGHDCVAYGTASLAGGAGSATGNPSAPNDAFFGYCAMSFGKNNLASGEKSIALGEEHVINTRSGIGLGYKVTSQPSTLTKTPVGAAGIGRDITLTGQSQALGSYLNAADGVLIGSGFNPGSPLTPLSPDECTIGMGTHAFRVARASGPGTRSKVGINNFRQLNNEIDIDISPSARMGVTIDGTGSATIALMGVKSDGAELPLVSFVWTHPNPGTAQGTLEVRMNGRTTSALTISAEGSVAFGELKDAKTVVGAPAGTIYRNSSAPNSPLYVV